MLAILGIYSGIGLILMAVAFWLEDRKERKNGRKENDD